MITHPVNEHDGKGWFKSKLRNPFVPISLVVMHSTAGSSLAGAISTLRQKGYGYHYLIDKDGTVWKGAPYSRSVGHAGNSYGPREESKRVSRRQDSHSNFVAGCSVNGYSIGISFVNENNGKVPITQVQLNSAEELVKELKAALPKLEWITTHAIVSPHRKTDPRLFGLNSFAKQVGLNPWRMGA